MASAMPPTGLFFPAQGDAGSRGQALKTAQTQQQGDYLNMFNAMNPDLGGGGGTGSKSKSGSSPGFNPTMTKPTLSISSGTIKPGTTGTTGTAGSTTPAYDYGAVESLAQRYAAPGVRQLRNTVQQVQQGSYENPNVKAQTLRETLAGYGQGLESVMAGAEKSAASVYGQEYAAKVSTAQQNAEIASKESMQASALAANAQLAEFQNEWKAYLMSGQ